MGHGRQPSPSELIDPSRAQAISETMHALATPSRVRILGVLYEGPCAVNDLAAAIGMESSAVSHQLRVLRHLGLVVGQRDGRQIVYELHDEHVGQLLTEAAAHTDHLRLGISGRTHLPVPSIA